MQAAGIEPRPHLEIGTSIRAFGLGPGPRSGNAHPPGPADIARILGAVADSQARVVVFDLRTHEFVHSSTVAALIDLSRQLRRLSSLLVVLVEDSILRASLRDAEMTHFSTSWSARRRS